MTNQQRCLSATMVVCLIGFTIGPVIVRADADDDGPFRGREVQTALPSGVMAITQSQLTSNGLAAVTTVEQRIPGGMVADTEPGQASSVGALRQGAGGGRGYQWPPVTVVVGPSTGGANEIVRGGPMSFESGPGGTLSFGGGRIGGWTFPSGGPAGQTTGWSPTVPVRRLDPLSIATRLRQRLGFPPITLKANPDPGLVSVPSWFWVEGYRGEIRTDTATESETHSECRLNNGEVECRNVTNSITVDLQETPARYEWTFGDNHNNLALFTTAEGLGRPYTDPHSPSPIAHRYYASSLDFFERGGYPIGLRVIWSAAFRVNGGGWQTLGDAAQAFDSRHQVRESQPVIVDGSER